MFSCETDDLQQDLDGVLVIVTRVFGGIHLGPDRYICGVSFYSCSTICHRFKHINQAARSALEKGHFLDAEGTTQANPRSRKRH